MWHRQQVREQKVMLSKYRELHKKVYEKTVERNRKALEAGRKDFQKLRQENKDKNKEFLKLHREQKLRELKVIMTNQRGIHQRVLDNTKERFGIGEHIPPPGEIPFP